MKDLTAALAFRDKFAYSIGSLGKELAHGLISCYVFLYCIQVLKLEVPFLGLLYLSHNILGIMTAPLLGIILDNLTCRFGKYKLLTFLGLILNCALLMAFYYLPQLTPSNVELTVGALYLAWSLSFFMIDLPSWSMLSAFNAAATTRNAMAAVPCITNHLGSQMLVICALPFLQQVRSLFDNFSYPLGALGAFYLMLISQSIFLFVLSNRTGGGAEPLAPRAAPTRVKNTTLHPYESYQVSAQGSFGALSPDQSMVAALNPVALSGKARALAHAEGAATAEVEGADKLEVIPSLKQRGYNSLSPHLSLKERLYTMFQVLVKNDQLMVIFLSAVLLYSAFGLILGAFILFLIEQHLLLNPTLYLIMLLGALLQLFAMASFERLMRRTNRTFIFKLAIYMSMGGFALMLGAEYSAQLIYPMLAATLFLVNLGSGLCKVALTSMTIDTVDYGEFKLSVRTDGLIFSLRGMANYFGRTIAFFFFGGALCTGYVQGQSSEPSVPVELSGIILIVLVLLGLALFLYLNFYKLNGAFYRNVLNNLQYLRQNQVRTSPTLSQLNANKFMLRYALDESTMIIKLNANNVDDILKAMVQKLSEVHAITSEHDYSADLKARLALGPCGIAEGIAIPHAKSSAVRRATVVVATLDHPIDLGALDGRACDLIFLLASPDDGYTHMNLLGRLSLLLNESGFANKLRASGSPTELFERMIQCERHIVH